jgi:hypothetical protein
MDDMAQIPYVVYEGTQARNERTTKRLVGTIILTILLLFISNGLWLYAWMQYDYTGTSTETTQDYWQDGDGYNNINTGTQGDVVNGTTAGNKSKDAN